MDRNQEFTIHIDVTRIAENDIGTGVQRVVRQISRHWLQSPERTAHLNFIRVTQKGQVVDAHNWTAQLMGEVGGGQLEEPRTTFAAGDQLFLLDLVLPPRGLNGRTLRHLQKNGVKVVCMIYDILPLSHPQFFPISSRVLFGRWFRKALTADQIVTISESTKQAILGRSSNRNKAKYPLPPISVIPMSGEPEVRIPAGASDSGESLKKPAGNLFICIGTVEPRKGYDEVVDTFERLWAQDSPDNLWIFGCPGWKTQLLQRRMRSLESKNTRFRWFPNAEDHLVQNALQLADALIASSFAEGSGLPLLEARALNKPVIARDLPAFREISDMGVYFFLNGAKGCSLASLLESWDNREEQAAGPKIEPRNPWEVSVHRLETILTR